MTDDDLGALSRAQVAAACGVSTATVEHWHRAGLLQASVRTTPPGSTRPNLYDVRDVTVGRFIAAARQLGLTRPQLAAAAGKLRADPQLRPGWHGWVALSSDGQVRISPSLELLVEVLEARRDPATVLTAIDTPYADRAGAASLAPQEPS